MISIQTNGALGDGRTVNTEAIQRTIDVVAQAGGGTVLVPSGHFICGPLALRSNVFLHLEAGALLQAHRVIEGWPIIKDLYPAELNNGRSSDAGSVCHPFIYAENSSNIGITGNGIINGSGEVWWPHVKTGKIGNRRPRLIVFAGCDNVLLDGFRAENSPQWTINPVCCENVVIRGLTVFNPPDSPNTDGINPDSCRHVRISGCHIDVGDDCITLKSGTETACRPAERRACENIIISECLMLHGHGAVVIGSEMSGGVRNVVISNCIFNGTDRGIRFKSRRGRGGIVENVRVQSIVMDDVKTPIVANLFYVCGARGEARVADLHAYPVDETTPRMERLHFSQITAKRAHHAAVFLYGLPEMPIKDVMLNEIDIQMSPDAKEGDADMAIMIPKMKRRAFFARHVSGLSLCSVKVEGFEGPFIDAQDCMDLRNYEGGNI
ncbi:MAG TPA: endopolygalacturonase [Lentisphaeria bacterium]|nr:MAG: hypothetical protein A2X45_25155 [Lentisphaerae bacterium GWF2_50_93]HCE42107.1 endopolygalacturonase [Lentisphaeria bacterium]